MCKVCDQNAENKPKEGDLRIWWIPQVPLRGDEAFHRAVKNIDEAKLLLDTLADYDWYLEAHRHRVDYSNVGGLDVFEDGEWCTWYDEDGFDIDEHFEAHEEEG